MRAHVAFFLVGLAIVAAGPGCGSASDASSAGAAGQVCVHDPSVNDTDSTKSDTLPAGRCSASAASCDPVVRVFCSCLASPPPGAQNIRIYYHCECTDGAWACRQTDIDAKVCATPGSPDCADGGTEDQ